MNLDRKVAVVTGGAVRVGRAISLALAQAGCHVFVHYGRSAGPALETKEEIEATGVEAEIFSADLSDVTSTQLIIPSAIDRFGKVDILINSAAIFLEGGLADTTIEMWDSQFAINLRAPFILSQAFAAQVPPGDAGAIVNIVDARIFRPAADHFAYRLTKSGLLSMTLNLAHELAPNIRVNAVALGAILPPPGKDDSYLNNLAQLRIPLQRAGNAEMVAQNVLHLLSQEFLTGVTIRIDGAEFL